MATVRKRTYIEKQRIQHNYYVTASIYALGLEHARKRTEESYAKQCSGISTNYICFPTANFVFPGRYIHSKCNLFTMASSLQRTLSSIDKLGHVQRFDRTKQLSSE